MTVSVSVSAAAVVKSALAYELGRDLERWARAAGAVMAMVYAAGLLCGEWLHGVNEQLAAAASGKRVAVPLAAAVPVAAQPVAVQPVAVQPLAVQPLAAPVATETSTPKPKPAARPAAKRSRKRPAAKS